MDRMRDRLDKIARRSMSAPAGLGDDAHPAPARPSTTTRQSAARQGKAPIPRSSASIPARSAARSTNPPARPPSSAQPAASLRREARAEGVVSASRRPVPLPFARRGETPTPQNPAGASAGRPAVSPSAPKNEAALSAKRAPAGQPAAREAHSTLASSTASTPPRPADMRAANTSASVADTLDTDRILDLPARVTTARKQRQIAACPDVNPPSASEPSEPPRVLPMPAKRHGAPATPISPADVAASDRLPPDPLPMRHTSARTPASTRRSAPATADIPQASRRPAPAAENRRAADQLTSEDSSLPENIESVGGAMQRFLAVLAERRRQRSVGGGNGDGGDPPRPVEDVCPVCGGAGYVRLDVPVGDPRFGLPVPCKCKEREFEERRRMEEERRVLELDRFFSLKPFGDKTFETFNPRVAGVKEAYEAAQLFAEDPTGAPFRWLVLMGGTGVGKTHLAAAIAHERLQARSSVFFAVVPDLLDHLRAAFAPSAEMPYNEMFETVREVEMLILDDLGSENSTAWATEKLFQIINYRYNFRMPTVITTNSRLFEHMDERIASRLADTSLSRTVVIEAPSRRPHPARKQAPPGRQPPPRW